MVVGQVAGILRAQGDPEATEEMLRRFDIEPLAPGEGVAFL